MAEQPRVVLATHQDFTVLQCVRGDIPAVHALSSRIFGHSSQDTPNEHPSLDDWYSRFDERAGSILAVCSTIMDVKSLLSAQELPTEALCSFLFAYESPSVQSGKMCMHVWLCATDISFRGKGITSELFTLVAQEAIQNRNHIDTLAVNTYPAYFPNMYRLLSRPNSGFECVLRRDRSSDRGRGGESVEGGEEGVVQTCFEKQLLCFSAPQLK